MKSVVLITFFFIYQAGLFCQDSIVQYYQEIAGKAEFGESNEELIRWTRDVKFYFDFQQSDSLKEISKPIIQDLNDLIEPINIYITKNKQEANSFIYCGNFSDFKKKYKIQLNCEAMGFSIVSFKDNQIGNSYIFINSELPENQIGKVLREEMTQSLGFLNDSWKYPTSIFYQGRNNSNQFSPIDKEIIRRHYNF
jgi:hypothetical protein